MFVSSLLFAAPFKRQRGLFLKIVFVALSFYAMASTAQAQFVVGSPVYYRITDTYGANATGITITANVPAQLTYTGCSGASCSYSGGVVTWVIPSLPAGQTLAVTYFANINSCSSNTVSISGSQISIASPQTIFNLNTTTFNVVCLTDTPTNTPTPTSTPTITSTFTPSSTSTPTGTPTNTQSPTPSPTVTNTYTSTSTFTATDTATITNTPTITDTPTITNTPTLTSTSTNTPTPTATPIPLYVWPNPFNPKTAVGGVLKAYLVPPGSTMSIYTVSGELIITKGESNGLIEWDARNQNKLFCSTGIYFFAIQNGSKTLQTGKILLVYS